MIAYFQLNTVLLNKEKQDTFFFRFWFLKFWEIKFAKIVK